MPTQPPLIIIMSISICQNNPRDYYITTTQNNNKIQKTEISSILFLENMVAEAKYYFVNDFVDCFANIIDSTSF